MRHFTTMVAIATFFTAGFAYAQSEPGPNYQHLKVLEWSIGEWVWEGEVPETIPGFGEKGDSFVMTIKIEWGLNKNVTNLRMEALVKEESVWMSEGTTGWDAEKQRLVSYSFDSLGARGEGIFSEASKDGFVAKDRTVSPDGTVKDETSTVKRIDRDTFTVQKTDIAAGGEKMPDEPPLEFKRKK
jgi:hypothetical protein